MRASSSGQGSVVEEPEVAAGTGKASAEEGESMSWKGFPWRQQWYPLAFSATTDKAVPHRVELFGEPIVLWWDPSASGGGAWQAMVDECPHRLAPLSEGRVDEVGRIECPYHGWAFEGSTGACAKIPQLEDMGSDSTRSRCGGTVVRILERQGLIWAWGEHGAIAALAADESLLPLCEAVEDPAYEWIDVSRDMPYSADMLLENVIDSSHVPFTHHKTISKRENGKPLPLRLTTRITASGFEGEFSGDAAVGKVGEEAAKAGRATRRSTKFVAPTYMHHKICTAGADGSFDSGSEFWTVAYATPSGPGRCRLFARFPFRFPPPKRGPNIPRLVLRWLPDWVNHLGQLRVLDDDNIFLPLQERRVQDAGGWRRYVMPASADTFVRAFRRWFDSAGPPPHAPFAVDEHRARAPSKGELLDRRAQHTAHCKSCSGALKNAERIRQACRFLVLAGFAMVPSLLLARAYKPAVGLAVSVATVAKLWQLSAGVVSGLSTGLPSYPPPRNRSGGRGRARELRTVEQGRRF